MGVVGLGLGFAVAGGWEGRFPVHRNLGLSATILGLFQASPTPACCTCSPACLSHPAVLPHAG